MKHRLASSRSVTVGVASVVAILVIAGAARAVTDNIFRYSTPETGYFAISQMALSPSATSDAENYSNFWEGGLFPTDAGTRCFNTGVNLPDGATITGLSVYYSSEVGGNPEIQFIRQQFSDGTLTLIAHRRFADDSGGRKVGNLAIDNALADVDNAQFSYGLGICLRDSRFFSARVRYTYDNAGD